jgi:hypothetical protein
MTVARTIHVNNRDVIATMPEDEIRAKTNQLRGWIESDRRRGHDTYRLEVEYCYLSDELRVRENRKRTHEEYLRNLPAEDFEYENYEEN